MSAEKDLNMLLNQEDFKWVRNQLFPILNLLNLDKEVLNGYFTLPLSKENVIHNLKRVTKKNVSEIRSQLEEFEDNFSEFIDINKDNYEYYTGFNTYNHPPRKNPCPDQENSAIYYILDSEIKNRIYETYKNLEINIEDIIKEISSKVKTHLDLIHLGILKNIIKKNKFNNFFNYDLKENIRSVLEDAEIDNEIINYYLGYDSPFRFNEEKIFQFLQPIYNFYVLFYSHSFNSQSCVRKKNILILDSIAEKLDLWLEKVPLNDISSKKYNEEKNKYEKIEEKLPIFTYKDKGYIFLEKYYRKLISNEDDLYVFQIDEDDKEAQSFFIEKYYLKIENKKIFINPNLEHEFKAYYDTLEIKENQRITDNKIDIINDWMYSKFDLDNYVVDTSTMVQVREGDDSIHNDIKVTPVFEVAGDTFKFYIKVENLLDYRITDVIVRIKLPYSLKIDKKSVSSDFKLSGILPHKFETAFFYLYCDTCTDTEINTSIEYIDPKGKFKVEIMKPFQIVSCKYVKPREIISSEELNQILDNEEKRIVEIPLRDGINGLNILEEIKKRITMSTISSTPQLLEMFGMASDGSDIGIKSLIKDVEGIRILNTTVFGTNQSVIFGILSEIMGALKYLKTVTKNIKDDTTIIINKVEELRISIENHLKQFDIVSDDINQIKNKFDGLRAQITEYENEGNFASAEKIHDEISELRSTLKDLYYKRENQSETIIDNLNRILKNQKISEDIFRQRIGSLEQYLYDHLDTDLEQWKKIWEEYKIKNIGKSELIKRSLRLVGPKFIKIILNLVILKKDF